MSLDDILESSLKLPAPTVKDFDDDCVTDDERQFCIRKYSDLNRVKLARMHCTACNKHLGLSAQNVNKLHMHPLLRTLICIDCLEFYNSGEFLKGEDGSELYCRWCGQGGQVYCCASCPVVFCENCIKRNFGQSKIEDIESIDDWNCFLCNQKSLWCHRASLWAAKRYCQLKNKYANTIADPSKRMQIQKECLTDESGCCKRKTPKPNNAGKSKQSLNDSKKIVTPDKKNLSADCQKALKRLASPVTIKKISSQPATSAILANLPSALSVTAPSSIKKFAMGISTPPMGNIKSPSTPRMPYGMGRGGSRAERKRQNNMNMHISNQFMMYNGMMHNNYASPYVNYSNDNVNLSIESLTQGLDMSNMQNNDSHYEDDNLICTPDLPMPLEPVCEVTEELDEPIKIAEPLPPPMPMKIIDDDVQCLTPTPKLIPRPLSALTDPKPKCIEINPNNLIQMSDKDVSINKVTGGLKFRVDPATLSTSKMYQLPDGRVFAVNVNPKMPGGYSATIVIPTEPTVALMARPSLTVRTPSKLNENKPGPGRRSKRMNQQNKSSPHAWTTPVVQNEKSKSQEKPQNPEKEVTSSSKRDNSSKSIPTSSTPVVNSANSENNSSVEWYTYNLYNAYDFIAFISKKLTKMKKNTSNLRGKSVQEIKDLHFQFDQLLKVTCQRFTDLRSNLNNDFKHWIKGKNSIELFSDDEDDDDKVEITSDTHKKPDDDEPIFIDENSSDSMKYTHMNHSKKSSSDGMPVIQSVMCEYMGTPKDVIDDNIGTVNMDADENDIIANKSDENDVVNKNESAILSKNDENEVPTKIDDKDDDLLIQNDTDKEEFKESEKQDDVTENDKNKDINMDIDDNSAMRNESLKNNSDNAIDEELKNDVDHMSVDNMNNLEESCGFKSENSNSNFINALGRSSNNDFQDLSLFSEKSNSNETPLDKNDVSEKPSICSSENSKDNELNKSDLEDTSEAVQEPSEDKSESNDDILKDFQTEDKSESNDDILKVITTEDKSESNDDILKDITTEDKSEFNDDLLKDKSEFTDDLLKEIATEDKSESNDDILKHIPTEDKFESSDDILETIDSIEAEKLLNDDELNNHESIAEINSSDKIDKILECALEDNLLKEIDEKSMNADDSID